MIVVELDETSTTGCSPSEANDDFLRHRRSDSPPLTEVGCAGEFASARHPLSPLPLPFVPFDQKLSSLVVVVLRI
jgi:hypothetical protein